MAQLKKRPKVCRTEACRKKNIKILTRPWWKSKRAWMNMLIAVAAGVDFYSGWVRELLPGKEGAALLVALTVTNLYFNITNKRRFREAVDDGDIQIIDKAD